MKILSAQVASTIGLRFLASGVPGKAVILYYVVLCRFTTDFTRLLSAGGMPLRRREVQDFVGTM
jgi:hypothetical protein